MLRNEGQKQTAKQTNSDDIEEVVNLQSKIEFLSEQIESLNLELSYKDQKIEELENNLSYTHAQLESLNQENHYLAVENQQLRLSLSKFKNLAQEFLLNNQDKQSIKETFATLVNEIFDTVAAPKKLEDKQNQLIPQQDSRNSRLFLEYSANFAKFHAQFNEFGSKFVSFQAQIMGLRNKLEPCEKQKVDNRKARNELKRRIPTEFAALAILIFTI